MKCLVCVDHDIIYRNFVQSGALDGLARAAELMFVFPDSPRVTVDLAGLPHPWVKMPVDTVRTSLWRRLFQVMQMRWRPGANWRAIRASQRFTLGWKGSIQIGFLALPGVFGFYRRHLLARLRGSGNVPLEKLVHDTRPDILLLPTVLEGPFLNDLIDIGRRLGIPTVAIMNSWDNPSTKRSVVGTPDWLLVWGPQTRDHGIRYAGMDPQRVVHFGAAQLDVFRKQPRYDRTELCARHGIDPRRRVILYAGSTKHADEFGHLVLIDQAIAAGELPDVAIIYRPHPWGLCGSGGQRFAAHQWQNVFLDASMQDYVEQVGQGQARMKLADYRDSHDLLSAIDALVSPMSTILLEAAMHGKPILCFQSGMGSNESMRVRVNQAQFAELFRNAEVLVCGDDDFLAAMRRLAGLAADPGIGQRMRAMCEEFVSAFDAPFSERLPVFLQGHLHNSSNDKDLVE
jgi:glycosyltransferase involved in cell wall biosynthesis